MSQLFDPNPRGEPRHHGIGYATKKKARKSIKLIAKEPLSYQMQVAVTMFYRAKHHAHQTKNMRDSMKVWGSWIKLHRKKRMTRKLQR